jgi:hypothetical protein
MAEEPKTITDTLFVETKSFHSSHLDDEDARRSFIETHKLTKAQSETVTLVDKRHDIGVGITYTFRAEK